MARANPHRDSWLLARGHGIKKDIWAKALGVSRNRADDLTAGRERATLGEVSALNTGKRSWLVRYKDQHGGFHGFYTGRGRTLDELIESEAIEGISTQQLEDSHPEEALVPDGVISIEAKYPNFPQRVRIYATTPGGIHSWKKK